jgi:hypothetical protein
MRGIAPMMFLLGAGAVLGFNTTHANQAIVFPGLERFFPQYAGNLQAQGQLTVYLLAGMALLLALLEFRNFRKSE